VRACLRVSRTIAHERQCRNGILLCSFRNSLSRLHSLTRVQPPISLHPQLSVTHFGEMLTLWDFIMGTHTSSWNEGKYRAQAARVAEGVTGLDEAAWKAG
jgi:hypothetical protein